MASATRSQNALALPGWKSKTQPTSAPPAPNPRSPPAPPPAPTGGKGASPTSRSPPKAASRKSPWRQAGQGRVGGRQLNQKHHGRHIFHFSLHLLLCQLVRLPPDLVHLARQPHGLHLDDQLQGLFFHMECITEDCLQDFELLFNFQLFKWTRLRFLLKEDANKTACQTKSKEHNQHCGPEPAFPDYCTTRCNILDHCCHDQALRH